MREHGKAIATGWVIALALALLVPASGAAPPRRLAADFTMERTIRALSGTVRSSGRLYLGGPGLLRWETFEPARSVLVVNGGRGWIHYPGVSVTKSFDLATDPVMKVLSEHMLALTAGDLEAAARLYRVVELDGGLRRLQPLDPAVARVFSEIRVSFSAPGVVGRVELVSPGGDSTVLTFRNVEVDPPLDAALFGAPVN
jgi:outer membrane lipoprotein-sorting protein